MAVTSPDISVSGLVCVRRLTTMAEARVIVSVLSAADVPAFLFDGGLAEVAWHYEFALGGLRVMVPAQSVQDAQELLRVDTADVTEASDGGCAHCGSHDVAFLYSWWSVPLTALALSVPILVWRHRRFCRRCKYSWWAESTD